MNNIRKNHIHPQNVKFDDFGFPIQEVNDIHTRNHVPYRFQNLVIRLTQNEPKKLKKWNKILRHFNHYIRTQPKIIEQLLSYGVPHKLRLDVWYHFSGGMLYEMDRKYKKLLKKKINESDSQQIERDIYRQFTNNLIFQNIDGNQHRSCSSLRNILHAYVAYSPECGYNQAHSAVGAFFLIMGAEEERAFSLLARVSDIYLHQYYSKTMSQFKMDCRIFEELLKETYPKIYEHFEEIGVLPEYFLPEWFLCLFTRSLPWPTTLYILDQFFYHGIIILFRVAIILLDLSFSSKKYLPHSVEETVMQLNSLCCSKLLDKSLGRALINSKIDEELLLRLHKKIKESQSSQ
ncbi:hypothetical protein SNEBB_009356 [Seison nebaliae]|nr:hypothetical protein SNEBB_009356 [Seison nebaliae]